jgi:hypothetical protein
MANLTDALARIAADQDGILHRDQLRGSGLSPDFARHQIKAQRWRAWGHHVVAMHNNVLTRNQLMWVAVLDAGYPWALASHTALELAGFQGFAAEAAQIHLLVPRGAKVAHMPDVVVHESRRVKPEWHVRDDGLPRTPVARSAIDAAAWQPWPRFACAMMAAVVQQRLVTAHELDAELAYVGRVRHKAYLREAIRDIAGGAEALSEIDLARLCRRFGLAPPRQQSRRRGSNGQLRFLDAEWDLPDGQVLVLEVDGAHHLQVQHWEADMRREREVVISGRRVLRATSYEVRVEARLVASDLAAAGVPRRLVRF